jgi:hypothetical protein
MNSLFLLAFLILVPGAIVLFLLQPTPTAPQGITTPQTPTTPQNKTGSNDTGTVITALTSGGIASMIKL